MDWWKEKFINRRDYMLDHLDELTMTSDETLLIMMIYYPSLVQKDMYS